MEMLYGPSWSISPLYFPEVSSMKTPSHWLLLICLTSIATPLAGRAQWTEVELQEDALGNWSVFTHIDAADSMYVMALGAADWSQTPFVRGSTDGGVTWRTLLSDSTYLTGDTNAPVHYPLGFRDISTPSRTTALVVGDSGSFWRTSNWGNTWVHTQFGKEGKVLKLSMLDSMYGVAFQYRNLVWVTDDGGRSWQKTVVDTTLLPAGYLIDDITIVSRNTWLLTIYNSDGESDIARTTDAGVTWNLTGALRASDIDMINERVGIAVGGGKYQEPGSSVQNDIIQMTTNGGMSWETVIDALQDPHFGLRGVSFATPQFGLAVGGGRKALRSTDFGETWSPFVTGLPKEADLFELTDVAYPTATIAYATTWKGRIFKARLQSVADVNDSQEGASASLLIRPNPTTGRMGITAPNEAVEDLRIIVSDVLGRTVLSRERRSVLPGEELLVDGSGFDNGAYFVRVATSRMVYISRVVIAR
jgi:photosystem II stability/assembly factor-like uncharacterized protein